jgi:hypothetical protein
MSTAGSRGAFAITIFAAATSRLTNHDRQPSIKVYENKNIVSLSLSLSLC